MPKYIAALGQGKTGTRFMIFDHDRNATDAERRKKLYSGWKKAVTRTFGWVE